MLQQNPRDVTALFGENSGTQLERLNVLLEKLGMGLNTEEALEILQLFDLVAKRLAEMDPESQGGKLTSAEFEAVTQTYKKHLGMFLRAVGDPARLEAARRAAAPPESRWWWFPERLLEEERKGGLLKALRGLAVAAAILGVLVVVYLLFLQPDPKTIAAMDARRAAEQVAVDTGDYQAALAEVEKGLIKAPGDSDLLVLKGTLLTLIGGRDPEAEAAFREAEKAMGKLEYVYLMRAQNLSILGKPALAQSNAEEAIRINPESAQGYLILGQALEDQRDLEGAYQSYEKASTLSNDNNDPTVTAQARMKMGILLQSMGMDSLNPAPMATP
jgi:tetratricopeptide (TPR) repeat protein